MKIFTKLLAGAVSLIVLGMGMTGCKTDTEEPHVHIIQANGRVMKQVTGTLQPVVTM